MAVTTTNFTPPPVVFPFLGLGQLGLDRSSVPRSELLFKEFGGDAITAGGVGNTQRSTIICNLPQNFAYAIAEIHISLRTIAGTTNSWNKHAKVLYSDAQASERTFKVPLALQSQGVTDTESDPTVVYSLVRNVNSVLVPPTGTMGQSLNITFNNAVEDAPETTLVAFIRVYQFDIEQAHHYAVNTPQLVR